MELHRDDVELARAVELALAAERLDHQVGVDTLDLRVIHVALRVGDDTAEADALRGQRGDHAGVVEGPLSLLPKLLGHLQRQQLHRTRAEKERRIGETAVERGHAVQIVQVGGVHAGGSDHRVGHRTTDSADAESRRHRVVAQDRVALEAALAVETVDTQQRAVAAQRGTAAGIDRVVQIHRSVAVPVQLVERSGEDLQAGLPQLPERHLADEVLGHSHRAEVPRFSWRRLVRQDRDRDGGQYDHDPQTTDSFHHRSPLASSRFSEFAHPF